MTAPAATVRVTLQFRKDGPSSSGWWTNPEVAERKFTEWLGTYGSQGDAILQLIEEKNDGSESAQVWPPEDL